MITDADVQNLLETHWKMVITQAETCARVLRHTASGLHLIGCHREAGQIGRLAGDLEEHERAGMKVIARAVLEQAASCSAGKDASTRRRSN